MERNILTVLAVKISQRFSVAGGLTVVVTTVLVFVLGVLKGFMPRIHEGSSTFGFLCSASAPRKARAALPPVTTAAAFAVPSTASSGSDTKAARRSSVPPKLAA